jgi:L-amino acid N-acyltransferase YncA
LQGTYQHQLTSMTNRLEIRLINDGDAASSLEIYRHYVRSTVISFEYEVPDLNEFRKRIEHITSKYPWIVCVSNNEIIGYAYASDFRYREAYSWSCESTIYLKEGHQGKGTGRILYETLFKILNLQGYYNVFAGLAIPNEKSE